MTEVTGVLDTSYKLAKELLERADDFLTATIGDEEFIVENIQRIATYANFDNTVTHWTLKLRDCGQGNIKR